MSWKIKVLNYGWLKSPKSVFTPGVDTDVMMQAPYLGFLLQKNGQNVLVDTGINEKYIVNGRTRWGNCPAEGGTTYVLRALEQENLTPEDIDMVLYTHLHNDHTGACACFPHAETIFQKAEWENLLNPLPSQLYRNDYDQSVIDIFKKMENVVMVDGDVELGNGLKLYLTPGHTKGSMCIYVPTDDGPRLIVGDLFYAPYFLFPQDTDKFITMNGEERPITPLPKEMGPILTHFMIYDQYAYYASYNKIRALMPAFEPKYFLYGHDSDLIAKGVQ